MIEYPAGTPSWVDLSSPDPDGSASFYGELLGWESPPGEGAEHRIFTVAGAGVAGLSSAPGTPLWRTYIAVDDIDATQSRINAAGGTDAATTGVFIDREGAHFSVQADRHRGAQRVNAPGTWTMSELRTRDLETARAFYREVFGWDVVPIEQGGQVVYAGVQLDGRLVAGMLPMGEAFPPELPPHWIPYFGVPDVEAAAEMTRGLGGQALSGPIAVPKGRFVPLVDPQGAAFMVMEAEYDPPPGS
jgi:predicted enzyme related to lactoylglutathione lyase